MRALFIAVTLLVALPSSADDISLTAPSSTTAGGKFTIGWSGESQPLDMITVVEKGSEDGEYTFSKYPSRETSPMSFIAPDKAGDYEVRYLRYANPGYAVAARRAISLNAQAAVALVAPASVVPGRPFSVSWSGPNADGDELRLVTPGGAGSVVARTSAKGRSAKLEAPNQRGDYLLQYVRSGESLPLGTVTVTVGPSAANRSAPPRPRTEIRQQTVSLAAPGRGVGATLEAPDSVMAGQPFDVQWTGPDNNRDYLVLTTANNPTNALAQANTNRGSPARLMAPDEPGLYRIHYVAASRDLSLGSTAVNVTASGENGALRVLAPGDSAFQVYDLKGSVAGAGAANDEPINLAAGDYVVRVDGRVVQVRVRAGGTTDLNLR